MEFACPHLETVIIQIQVNLQNGLPWWLSGKKFACQCRRCRRGGFNLQVETIPWRRKWQYSCLENPMDRETWRATVHRVAKSQTWQWLSTFARIKTERDSQIEHICTNLKQKETHRFREWTYDCLYTILYLRWITNKDLLYSTWNSAQCYMAVWMGGEFGREWIHVYVWLSPFTVHPKLSQHC